VARKATDKSGERRTRTPLGRTRRLASEPIEEVAGRVRTALARPANDNLAPRRHWPSAHTVALSLASAALGGLIAALLLA
jgi:hypothetical protein